MTNNENHTDLTDLTELDTSVHPSADAAYDALTSWATDHANSTPARAALVRNAWKAGHRNIRRLAEAADVTRKVIYSDLKLHGIDATRDRDAPITTVLDEGHMIRFDVDSFGYLHRDPAALRPHITVDVRESLRDPQTDPDLLTDTGLDSHVRHQVLSTPGALELIGGLVSAALGQLASAHGDRIRIAIGCAGGRHRSVVIADEVAERLLLRGHGVVLTHRDVRRTVVTQH